jgi:hypothetical protein
VKRYVNMRLEAGAANVTVNRELEIVKKAFFLAATSDPPKVARVTSRCGKRRMFVLGWAIQATFA